jgi:hypothetical protein
MNTPKLNAEKTGLDEMKKIAAGIEELGRGGMANFVRYCNTRLDAPMVREAFWQYFRPKNPVHPRLGTGLTLMRLWEEFQFTPEGRLPPKKA